MKRAIIIAKAKRNYLGKRRIRNINEDYNGEFTSFERSGEDIPQKATLDDLLGVLKSFDSKAERLVSILGGMDVTLKSVKGDTSSIKEK